jgi:hypothetical protein
MRAVLLGWLAAAALIAAAMPCSSAGLTDDQVRQHIIQESIASYPGNCPCRYNVAANGTMCGKRSAWSKPGGYAPICYPEDVTQAMIARWRQQNGG